MQSKRQCSPGDTIVQVTVVLTNVVQKTMQSGQFSPKNSLVQPIQSKRQCSLGDNLVQTIQSWTMQSRRQCSPDQCSPKYNIVQDNVVQKTKQSQRHFSPGQCISPKNDNEVKIVFLTSVLKIEIKIAQKSQFFEVKRHLMTSFLKIWGQK